MKYWHPCSFHFRSLWKPTPTWTGNARGGSPGLERFRVCVGVYDLFPSSYFFRW